MIERLYVHNYRCFENFTLDLKGLGSALIIGKNGSGKSTLRHALGVFQKIGRGPNRAKDLIDPSDCAQQRIGVPIRFEVAVRLDGRRFDYAIAFDGTEQLVGVRVSEEHLQIDGTAVFTRSGSSVQFDSGSLADFELPGALLPIMSSRNGNGTPLQLTSFFRSMLLLSPVPATMTGYGEVGTSELGEDGGNFSAWLGALLQRHPSRYAHMHRYLTTVMTDFAEFEQYLRGERGMGTRVLFESNGAAKKSQLSVDFQQLSDGEKCFFLSAVIAGLNTTGNPVFCFWDEPDNHLSLPEVGHFIVELRRMSNRGGQFLATSHNPATIRAFSDENTFVFRRASHLEPTTVRTLAEIGYHGDLIAALARDEVM